MNLRSRMIVGLSLVALGAGVVALGLIDQESDVRYVADVVERPEAHMRGEYTLLGMPQPPMLAGVGEGVSEVPNPEYRNSTQRVVRWTQGGIDVFSTLTLTVHGPDAQGVSHWTLRNESRAPERPDIQFEATSVSWNISRPHMVFLIQGFATPGGDTPFVFGVYEGVLREPVQPKPSQFRGHLATHLPGGVAVPDGALVYAVKEYTAGCSSKFLPPELKEEYKDDPDYQ